ncbi:MAG: hypothetical protein NZV14_17280 [Bryobacteraceae bacterium]|nr:hypothetical protein [Bryobacteraceae bacterium]MDW8379917.1 hypothetical protein [Bryobacterales bacterium]
MPDETQRTRLDRRRWIPLWIAGVILGSQLLVEPIVGLADNGDFGNVSNAFSIFRAEPDHPAPYFSYVVQHWRADRSQRPQFRVLSSELLLLAPSVVAVAYLAGAGYDLRWAGLTHLAVFLATLYILYPVLAQLPGRRPVVAWGLLLLVWCDVSYFSYFNSFYTDTASLLFLLLLIALYLRLAAGVGKPRNNAFAFLVVCGLFLTSKAQHAVLVVLLAPWLLLDPNLAAALGRRVRVLAALLLTAMAAACLRYLPPEYRAYAAYNVIFAELLPKAPDAKAVLRELGLPENLARYAGKDAFHPESAMRQGALRADFGNLPSHVQLVRHYGKHPGVAARLIGAALEESALQRPEGFGNFTVTSSQPPRARSEAFAVWSNIKRAIFQRRPRLYGSFLIALGLAFLFTVWGSARRSLGTAVVFSGLAAIEFLLGALADCRETTRHLFLFHAMQDAALLFVVIQGLAVWRWECGRVIRARQLMDTST